MKIIKQNSSDLIMIEPKHFGFNIETAEDNHYQINDDLISEIEIKQKAKAEVLWTHGIYDDSLSKKNKPVSRSFEQSGFYIMANDEDHVFIDCGPVGFSGKGGHGHNDCLSFDGNSAFWLFLTVFKHGLIGFCARAPLIIPSEPTQYIH